MLHWCTSITAVKCELSTTVSTETLASWASSVTKAPDIYALTPSKPLRSFLLVTVTQNQNQLGLSGFFFFFIPATKHVKWSVFHCTMQCFVPVWKYLHSFIHSFIVKHLYVIAAVCYVTKVNSPTQWWNAELQILKIQTLVLKSHHISKTI